MAKVARFTQDNQNPVGMIVPSMLTEAQFQAINGTAWVLAAGQSAVGSVYATTTGSSTLPDLRGRVLAGKDDMRGTPANRLTSAGSGVDGNTIGAAGGAETHTLTSAQMPSHTHNLRADGTAVAQLGTISGGNGFASGGTGFTSNTATQSAGSGSAHQNTQPTLIVNYFIKIN